MTIQTFGARTAKFGSSSNFGLVEFSGPFAGISQAFRRTGRAQIGPGIGSAGQPTPAGSPPPNNPNCQRRACVSRAFRGGFAGLSQARPSRAWDRSGRTAHASRPATKHPNLPEACLSFAGLSRAFCGRTLVSLGPARPVRSARPARLGPQYAAVVSCFAPPAGPAPGQHAKQH